MKFRLVLFRSFAAIASFRFRFAPPPGANGNGGDNALTIITDHSVGAGHRPQGGAHSAARGSDCDPHGAFRIVGSAGVSPRDWLGTARAETEVPILLMPSGSASGGAVRSMAGRSEERRVGKEWVSTCRSRWAPEH